MLRYLGMKKKASIALEKEKYNYICHMSNISHQPHDKLTRRFLRDKKVAIDLLKKELPKNIVERLDLSTLIPTSETAIDEEWKQFHNDIVFHCKTKDNKDTYIYMLIEHQSTPDPFMPVRVLRYKMNVVGKYLDAKKKPNKLPNIVSLVIYNGIREYPYAKDLFSCFEDKELARQDITEPLILLDLSDTPDEEIIKEGGADAVLKLLLKWGRERDFIKKLQNIMTSNPKIFVSLSIEQAGYMYDYAMFVGEGNPKNAQIMKEALQKTYGESKAKKIFSLADYYEEQGIQKGIQKGIESGIQAVRDLFVKGFLTEEQAKKAEEAIKAKKK